MLRLQGIKKNYTLSNGMTVEALKGIDIRFRKSEFVSVLGPSGCGKTTLLNVIGGLDHPSAGTLYIDGTSTSGYNDRDWDTYRNHSIGFVFQSYNLIPHMSVLANVELAPIIAGVSKEERRKRAVEALEKVGLGDQLDKKPNQLSGGQMQRVAIARALVNDPEILLADEPTGALDTKTSVQIMEILKSISKDRLIIMVTHNPELAKEYSSRIVSLKDGLVVDDTDPYEVAEYDSAPEEPKHKKTKKGKKKSSMSFFTALSLSTRNLLTKKTRTLLTSFAGSIGIIGIALILSLSNGVQAYINQFQEDTNSAYPLTLNKVTNSSSLSAMLEITTQTDNDEFEEDRIYPDDTMGSMLNAMTTVKTNDLPSFVKYYNKHKDELKDSLTAITYVYDLNVNIYSRVRDKNNNSKIMQTNPTTIFEYMGEDIKNMMSSMIALSGSSSMSFYSEMLEGLDGELINPVVKQQYELVGKDSRWPQNKNEVVLMVDEKNRISNMSLYALGFKDPDEIEGVLDSLFDPDKEYNNGIEAGAYYELSDFLGHTFTYVMNTDYYVEGEGKYTVDGKTYPVWEDVREKKGFNEEEFLKKYGKDLTIVGIIRQNKDATSASINTPVAYTAALAREIMEYNNASAISVQQNTTPGYDVFTGMPFEEVEYTTENIDEFLNLLSEETKAELISMLNTMMSAMITEESLPQYLSQMDDNTFAALVKMYAPAAPTYTKEQVSAFIESLSVEKKAQLIATLSHVSTTPVTEATLPQVLSLLTDEQFNSIVTMFTDSTSAYTKEEIPAFLEAIGAQGRAALVEQIKKSAQVTPETLKDTLKGMEEKQYAQLISYYMPENHKATFESNLTTLGYEDESRIRAIHFYAVDFASKDNIKAFINNYNDYAKKNLGDGHTVEVSDMIGALLSGVNIIINAISYVLIAFVAISLIVSSIMIAIITYISVLERTKEIGILRSLGASKSNISSVFNAETIIEGFCAGLLGVGITALLCLIINPIIHVLTGIKSINAALPIPAAIILILISVGLTVLAGLVPSLIAADKDPVIALRTE